MRIAAPGIASAVGLLFALLAGTPSARRLYAEVIMVLANLGLALKVRGDVPAQACRVG